MIYLDHQATTPCDPRVIESMLPWLTDHFGNPHSLSHEAGRDAAHVIDDWTSQTAAMLNVPQQSVVFTSGATESNNLAIRGVCNHPRQKRRHIVTSATEHPAVLDVVADLETEGFQVTSLRVNAAGIIDLNQLADVVDDSTALVSVMWANNEIGTIAPMAAIAEICHRHGALLHSDATQAVGRIEVDAQACDVDLLSASAHKFYGPKGTGLLLAGNGNRRVRLKPMIVGGGQQRGLRSGTMNPAGIVALGTALRVALEDLDEETARVGQLRDKLAMRLQTGIAGLTINGPPMERDQRLAANLSCTLPTIEGEAWMIATPQVAFSSGSACSSTQDQPSHVLRAIGLSESEARRSVRFGVGRFNSQAEIDEAADKLLASYERFASLTG